MDIHAAQVVSQRHEGYPPNSFMIPTMAQATYKMELGAGGGYVAYVQIVSPLLADKSGKWFVVVPDNDPAPPGAKPHEYSTLWKAEQAARETALRLATKVSKLENAEQTIPPPPVIHKHTPRS